MNKPNRKFTPKPDGGERSERPRRPRTNEEGRSAGFSDKRYSPILDPDDNKEWQQRDQAGRSYRPASGEGEGPRRPRSEGFRADSPRGDGPRSGPRREGPRGDAPRGDNFRTGGPRSGGPRSEFRGGDDARPNFRKSEGGFDGERKPRVGGSDSAPRYGNKRGGENRYGDRSESSQRSDFRKDSDSAADRGDYSRRPNRDDKPQWGNKPQFRAGGRDGEGGFKNTRPGFNRDEDSSSAPRSGGRFGNKPAGNRSEGYGNSRGEDRRGEDGRVDSRRDSFRSSEEPRSGRRGESRFNTSGSESRFNSPRSEGRFNAPGSDRRESNTGRRGESRFSKPYDSDSKPARSRREGNDSEDREQGSFKKKTFSERQPSSISTPPTYDFSKIRGKGPKVAHTDAVIRLNKYIADAGICSRRDADELIATGQIKVNGEVITQMGHKVSRNDTVTFNGRKINPEKLVYVLLNKPKDFITTTEDPHERKTVMQLVNNAAEQRIYPVGRLDRNTTGLLLLTNDGELAEKLSHPSHKVKKVYQVLLDKPLTDEDFDKVEKGVVLEDGPAPVDELSYVIEEKTVVGVEIHIGRNRIVRRIFESLGYEVLGLDRVIYAGLTKKDLPRGHWRYLSEKEVIRLKHFS